jgi:RsiW-degrading membrane proteinase PrsW (M82 family)
MAAMPQEISVRQRVRKLVGTFALVALVVGYCIVAGAIYANFLGGQAWWVLVTYFAVAGLLWFVPAAMMIRWMARPDA